MAKITDQERETFLIRMMMMSGQSRKRAMCLGMKPTGPSRVVLRDWRSAVDAHIRRSEVRRAAKSKRAGEGSR